LLKYDQKVDAVITGLNEYRNVSPIHYMIIQAKDFRYIARGDRSLVYIKERIKFLLSNGHPIDALDRKNRTPLHYVLSKQGRSFTSSIVYKKMIKFLLNNGANPLLKDSYGYGQKPSDYIKKRAINEPYFMNLFNAEKKKITLFELMLEVENINDDSKSKYKRQRIK